MLKGQWHPLIEFFLLYVSLKTHEEMDKVGLFQLLVGQNNGIFTQTAADSMDG